MSATSRITVTTYGEAEPHKALEQAGVALRYANDEGLTSCACSFWDGSQVFVETTKSGNWSIKVQNFPAGVKIREQTKDK